MKYIEKFRLGRQIRKAVTGADTSKFATFTQSGNTRTYTPKTYLYSPDLINTILGLYNNWGPNNDMSWEEFLKYSRNSSVNNSLTETPTASTVENPTLSAETLAETPTLPANSTKLTFLEWYDNTLNEKGLAYINKLTNKASKWKRNGKALTLEDVWNFLGGYNDLELDGDLGNMTGAKMLKLGYTRELIPPKKPARSKTTYEERRKLINANIAKAKKIPAGARATSQIIEKNDNFDNWILPDPKKMEGLGVSTASIPQGGWKNGKSLNTFYQVLSNGLHWYYDGNLYYTSFNGRDWNRVVSPQTTGRVGNDTYNNPFLRNASLGGTY